MYLVFSTINKVVPFLQIEYLSDPIIKSMYNTLKKSYGDVKEEQTNLNYVLNELYVGLNLQLTGKGKGVDHTEFKSS